MKIDINIPTTILTQLGVQTSLPKIARGENRNFGLNKNHNNHMVKSQKPTNVGDPNKR